MQAKVWLYMLQGVQEISTADTEAVGATVIAVAREH